MTASRSFEFLRRSLLLDIAATGATALMLIVGAGFLSNLLGLPEILLRTAGLILVPFLGLVALTAAQPSKGALVWTVILCNAAWVVASIGLLISGVVSPTALGYAFVVAQAAAVGLFAELQFVGLRKASHAV